MDIFKYLWSLTGWIATHPWISIGIAVILFLYVTKLPGIIFRLVVSGISGLIGLLAGPVRQGVRQISNRVAGASRQQKFIMAAMLGGLLIIGLGIFLLKPGVVPSKGKLAKKVETIPRVVTNILGTGKKITPEKPTGDPYGQLKKGVETFWQTEIRHAVEEADAFLTGYEKEALESAKNLPEKVKTIRKEWLGRSLE